MKVDLLFYFERSLKYPDWLKLIKKFPIKNDNAKGLCQDCTSQLGHIWRGKLFEPQISHAKHHSNHACPFIVTDICGYGNDRVVTIG